MSAYPSLSSDCRYRRDETDRIVGNPAHESSWSPQRERSDRSRGRRTELTAATAPQRGRKRPRHEPPKTLVPGGRGVREFDDARPKRQKQLPLPAQGGRGSSSIAGAGSVRVGNLGFWITSLRPWPGHNAPAAAANRKRARRWEGWELENAVLDYVEHPTTGTPTLPGYDRFRDKRPHLPSAETIRSRGGLRLFGLAQAGLLQRRKGALADNDGGSSWHPLFRTGPEMCENHRQ